MDDGSIASPGTPSRWAVPWVGLSHGIGPALDSRKLLLAALGIVLTTAGWSAMDHLDHGDRLEPAAGSWVPPGLAESIGTGGKPWGLPSIRSLALVVTDPFRRPAEPFLHAFALGGGTPRFLHEIFRGLWALLVWGVIGAAIARLTLVQLATGDRLGMFQGLRFALGKIRPLLGAPLGCLAGIAFFAGLCAVPGLLYRIPGETGATIAGILTLFPLLAGILMTLILVGLVAGWPLMVATVAAEAEDTFDALSRSYSYVYQRTTLYAAYLAVAWVVGMVGIVVVAFLARLVVHFAAWGLAFGGPDRTIAAYFRTVADVSQGTAGAIHAGWLAFVALLTYAWVYSYAWSTAGRIYLLLRNEIDGAAFDDIALPADASAHFASSSSKTEETPKSKSP